MSKKPFSVRIPDSTKRKFNAIESIKATSQADTMDMILNHYIESMTDQEKDVYEALTKLWTDNQD